MIQPRASRGWIINSHPACAEASAGRPLGIDSKLRSMAMGLQKMLVLTQKRAFYLAASHRQIKKSLLCVLGVSAVKILFWTRMAKNKFVNRMVMCVEIVK